ncbi:nuclear transport factor 2 family protein [Nocardioides humi]|uniref:Nuclear transport factor 2 family protein n=1 Tax=Nocardioides humi TaxID=449461 RepID=A0ABN2BFB9_9ACTN|nr:nuclear transport factor 2 family protein [Nocardioides humi]
MDDLERLLAIEEIKKLKARYFRYLDQHRWEEYRALFTEDLVLDIPETPGPRRTRDQFVDGARAHLDAGLSIHHGHTPEIEILDDETAEGIWAMEDLVVPDPATGRAAFTGAGYYLEKYRKVDGSWRICHLSLQRLRKDEITA